MGVQALRTFKPAFDPVVFFVVLADLFFKGVHRLLTCCEAFVDRGFLHSQFRPLELTRGLLQVALRLIDAAGNLLLGPQAIEFLLAAVRGGLESSQSFLRARDIGPALGQLASTPSRSVFEAQDLAIE